jgi:hypothetical protein
LEINSVDFRKHFEESPNPGIRIQERLLDETRNSLLGRQIAVPWMYVARVPLDLKPQRRIDRAKAIRPKLSATVERESGLNGGVQSADPPIRVKPCKKSPHCSYLLSQFKGRQNRMRVGTRIPPEARRRDVPLIDR